MGAQPSDTVARLLGQAGIIPPRPRKGLESALPKHPNTCPGRMENKHLTRKYKEQQARERGFAAAEEEDHIIV